MSSKKLFQANNIKSTPPNKINKKQIGRMYKKSFLLWFAWSYIAFINLHKQDRD